MDKIDDGLMNWCRSLPNLAFVLLRVALIVLLFSIYRAPRHTFGNSSVDVKLPLVLKDFRGGYGSVTGRVVDASKKPQESEYYIPGATICAGDYWCDSSDEDGKYNLDMVSTPWQVIKASKNDYYDVLKFVNILADDIVTVNFALVPIQSSYAIVKRIVLTWSENPFWSNPEPKPGEPEKWENDLDVHLWYVVPGVTTHIGYYDHGNNNWAYDDGDCTTNPYTCLESDYREGFGPETIAISKLERATYYFGVLNYNQYRNGVPDIIKTGAKVDLYEEQGLVLSFTVPEQGEGNFWFVFSMSSNGEIAEITPMNCITQYTGDVPQCNVEVQMDYALPAKHLLDER